LFGATVIIVVKEKKLVTYMYRLQWTNGRN